METSNNEKMASCKWLVGNWKSKSDQGVLEENWKSLNDSTLQGTSFFIKDKDTLHHEAMVLQEIKNELVYKATIKGENNDEAISFLLISMKEKHLVFENAKHDFPQKISYQVLNDSTLSAKISGVLDGKPVTETYTLQKVE
ncbi:DUF6265 family protein [Flavobacterium sp. TSSA_36]|uniref:DUF6265 family protein n=1 Tax=Flavobacterium sp. TSSA_36 TaxID=3447669 RepID=UPI003F3BAE3E